MAETKVLLLAMPWTRPDYPSIQVGRLKSFLLEQGIECHASYPYLALAEAIGNEVYTFICETVNEVMLEGIFCSILCGDGYTGYQTEITAVSGLPLETIQGVAMSCSALLELECSRYNWDQYSHVGFTCTFSQTWASLAMARILKRRRPHLRIILGGSALGKEVAQYIVEQFPFVDHIVSGPGELALLDLLQEPETARSTCAGHPTLVEHLAIVPDYAEYFAQLHQTDMEIASTAILATSTGCDYNRCGFCSLNSEDRYVALSADQVGAMVVSCMEKHAVSRIEFADTSLVAIHSDDKLSNQLATLGVELYGQVRAVLNEERVKRLKKAGFSGVQIGIESFSTPVLKAMVKRADLVHNLFNLKLCLEHELEVAYNLILDYPGTSDEHLRQMIDLVPLIVHLPPPSSLCRFVLYRGSPAFLHPEKHGISAYHRSYLYELGLGDYYGRFWPAAQFDYAPSVAPSVELLCQMDSVCQAWASAYDPEHALLSAAFLADRVIISDRRISQAEVYELHGEVARCLRFCEQPRPLNDLESAFGVLALAELVDRGLLIIDNDRALSLPVTPRVRGLAPRDRPNSEFAYTPLAKETEGPCIPISK